MIAVGLLKCAACLAPTLNGSDDDVSIPGATEKARIGFGCCD